LSPDVSHRPAHQMGKSRLIQYYTDLQTSFTQYFKKAQERQGVEDIHQLRVYVKKLRTMWTLLEWVSHDDFSKKEHFALVSELFADAGVVREAQLNLAMISKYNSAHGPSYTKYIAKIQRQAEGKLLEEMEAFDFKRLRTLDNALMMKINGLSDKTVLKESGTLMLREMDKVNRLVDELHHNQKLHKVRTHLKKVTEMAVIMNLLDTRAVEEEWQSRIRSLGQRIGKWHDYAVLVASLKNFTEQRHRKKDPRRLKEFIRHIEHHKQAKQKKIHDLLDRYVTQSHIQVILSQN